MKRPAPADAAGLPAFWVRDFITLAAIWGSSFLFMRLAVVEFGALATAGMRVGIAAAFLLPVLLWQKQAQMLRQHWKPVMVVGLLSSAIPFALYAFALQSISTGLSAILNATTPLFAAVVAWLWLGERLNHWRSMGLVLGFAGVVVLAWDQARLASHGGMEIWAVLACLGACISYALATSFTRLHLSQVPALVTATGSQIGAAVGLALPMAWSWPAQMPSAQAWLAVGAVGVLCTGVAYLLFYRLIGQGHPSRTLSVTYLIPLFAVAYGLVLLDEHVTLAMVAGGGVILLGTALATGLLQPPRAA